MDFAARLALSIFVARRSLRLTTALAVVFLSGGGVLQAQERGWGDTWTHLRSDRDRQRQDALHQIAREVQEKKYAEAETHLDALVRQAPEKVDVRMMRAAVHAVMHRYDAALQDCAEAITLLQNQEPRALGEIYLHRAEIYNVMGKPGASRADLERAVRTDKSNAQFNNALAWLLATSPDEAVRDSQLALRYAQTANRLSGGHDPTVLDTLAAAEAAAGDFDVAAKHEREALGAAKGNKLHGGDKRLGLYEKHHPYREIASENFSSE